LYSSISLSGKDCHITQIAACHGDNETFSQYVLPGKPIQPQASQVTGLSCAGGQLYKDGKPVDAMRIREAINQFILWLNRFPNPVLVAHNATFDANVMSRTLSNLSIDATSKICGFVDSIPVFKTVVPGRSHYALGILVKELLNEDYDAHNAMADVKVLQKLLNVKKVTEVQMLKHSYSLAYIQELDRYQTSHMQNHSSLMPLVNDNVLSKQMITKVAASGLSLSHIFLAYKRDNVNGIKNIFSERGLGNKPRVTNNTKIIQNVCRYCETVCK
jgi:DNA polymerase III alpha subunit (gram-positive type)